MPDAKTNLAVVEQMVEDWNAGDMDQVAKAYSPTAVWHLPGRSTVSGDHEGWDAILGFFGACFERSGGTIAVEVIDLCAGEDHVVQWQRTTAEHDGRTMEVHEAVVHRMDGGRIVETFHRTETDRIEAFFGTA